MFGHTDNWNGRVFLTIQINQFLLLRQIIFNFIVVIIEIFLLLQ